MSRIKKFILRHKRASIYTFIAMVVAIFYFWPSGDPVPEEANLLTIQQAILNKQVESATIIDARNVITVQIKNGPLNEATYVTGSGTVLQEQLRETGTPFEVITDDRSFLSRNLFIILFYTFLIGVILGGPRLLKSGLDKAMGSGSADSKKQKERPTERFKDVKGADEAISELRVIVDSLKQPDKYKTLKLDRGIIFHGPTGTGKTLLAKALAGEAGVPFYRLGGAELESKWAGELSQRLGEFFKKVSDDMESNKEAPFVIFIDEIDGMAAKRAGNQGSDRNHNTAITQLLDQIGRLFENYPNAVIIAASNRLEAIDPAVKRAGRLGKHIAMPNPDQAARRMILELNSKDLNLWPADLDGVAKLTNGLSGASVARIPQEAALLATIESGPGTTLTRHHLERATMQIVMGTLRVSAVVQPEDDQIVRVHESGHATLAMASPYHNLLIATTIPIGASGGSTWCPRVDRSLLTTESVMWQMAIPMGGREAETLDCQQLSTGGSHDIESATSIALMAVCNWGLYPGFMSNIDLNDWESHPQAEAIDHKVQTLLQEASNKAKTVLVEHEAFRHRLQSELAAHRILYSDQLEALRIELAPHTVEAR